jgi:hypothetical protein
MSWTSSLNVQERVLCYCWQHTGSGRGCVRMVLGRISNERHQLFVMSLKMHLLVLGHAALRMIAYNRVG